MFKGVEQYSVAEQTARAEITAALSKCFAQGFDQNLVTIDYPPKPSMGDFMIPCFLLAKELKKNPAEAASFLAEHITPAGLIERVKATGPYLNFFVNRNQFNQIVLTEIFKSKEKFGKSKIGKGVRVMVEYFSPNTNKPLTVGHIRNICLGDSISKLLTYTGHKVVRATLYNNRGIAIAKAMVGYMKWGGDQTPKSAQLKPDHFVGSFYVRFNQEVKNDPNLDQAAQQLLGAWEKNDPKIVGVWQKLMLWVLEGFTSTLQVLGVAAFDEEYYESEFYHHGKEVVEKGLKKGIFVKDPEGVVLAPLEKYSLPDKIVLRPDQTSLYVTQDLYLAYLKDRYKMNKSIYVVGSEQDLYFQQLFKILELLGFKNAHNYYHLSYGMIRLPSGKIKSREGLMPGTGADELIAELEELASTEIKKREPELADAEIQKRARTISLAALKYYILAVNPKTTMVFNPDESIAFTGHTGPYIQYVVARINSIFEKVGHKASSRADASVLTGDDESLVINLLSRFPHVISEAVNRYDPSHVATYLYEVARAFSTFYEKVPILKAEKKVQRARMLLIADVKIVLTIGLQLLGIEVLERM